MISFLVGKGDKQYRLLEGGGLWPVFEHDPDIDGVEWRLRHNPDSVTREDMHYAASVISAYRHLMYVATTRRTAEVRRELRRGADVSSAIRDALDPDSDPAAARAAMRHLRWTTSEMEKEGKQ